MFKLYREAFKTTNDSIILATPLILFMWVLSAYITYTKPAMTALLPAILSFITTVLMVAAFSAGWFYMVKKAIKLSKQIFVLNTDRSKATFNLLKTMPSGIGKFFLSFVGMILIGLIIMTLLGVLVFKLGMMLIGSLNLDPAQIKNVMSSANDMKAFLDTLTLEQLLKLNNWNMLLLGTTSIISFLFMLWIPEVIYKTKNPVVALWRACVKIFQKPWKAFKLFLFISVTNIILSFLSTFAMTNAFVYFIMLVIYFYFIVYVIVLVFSYYEKEFE